jgi:hypothetical protein
MPLIDPDASSSSMRAATASSRDEANLAPDFQMGQDPTPGILIKLIEVRRLPQPRQRPVQLNPCGHGAGRSCLRTRIGKREALPSSRSVCW